MNIQPISLVAALAFFAATFFAGLYVGRKARSRAPWHYWVANAVALLLGVGIAAYGITSGTEWVWVGGFGAIAGGLSGLKYGLGRVVGQWREQPDQDDAAAGSTSAEIEPPA